MDQPVELAWHRSRDLPEGRESGDSVHGAPRGRAGPQYVGLTGAGWLAIGDSLMPVVLLLGPMSIVGTGVRDVLLSPMTRAQDRRVEIGAESPTQSFRRIRRRRRLPGEHRSERSEQLDRASAGERSNKLSM